MMIFVLLLSTTTAALKQQDDDEQRRRFLRIHPAAADKASKQLLIEKYKDVKMHSS